MPVIVDKPDLELAAGQQLFRVTKTAAHALGARLCYGEPVHRGDCTVIPVAIVATAGGLGFANAHGPAQEGGGGGGILSTRPVGFIEINGGKAQFRRIVTATDILQLIGGTAVLTTLLSRGRRRRRR